MIAGIFHQSIHLKSIQNTKWSFFRQIINILGIISRICGLYIIIFSSSWFILTKFFTFYWDSLFTFHHWYIHMIFFVSILFFILLCHQLIFSLGIALNVIFIIFFIFMIHVFVLYFIWYRLSSSVLPRVWVSSIVYINNIYLLPFLQLLMLLVLYIILYISF